MSKRPLKTPVALIEQGLAGEGPVKRSFRLPGVFINESSYLDGFSGDVMTV
jgi:hypothetical protein